MVSPAGAIMLKESFGSEDANDARDSSRMTAVLCARALLCKAAPLPTRPSVVSMRQ